MNAIPLRRWKACAAVFGQIAVAAAAAPLAALCGHAHRPRRQPTPAWVAGAPPVEGRTLAA